MIDDGRIDALEDLVRRRTQVPEAVQRLKAFPWDSETELVTLTLRDARSLLDAYLENRLSRDDVERWADAVEGRDDVGFEESYKNLLKEFVFELATPEIAGPLTQASAEHWKARLA